MTSLKWCGFLAVASMGLSGCALLGSGDKAAVDLQAATSEAPRTGPRIGPAIRGLAFEDQVPVAAPPRRPASTIVATPTPAPSAVVAQRKPGRTAFDQITARAEAAPESSLTTAASSLTPSLTPSLTSGLAEVGAVQFALGSAKLSREARAAIDQLAERVKASGDGMLVIGHTCAIGSDDYNLKLSVRRAKAVRDRLARAGVAPDRLAIEGDGERQLLTGLDEADPRNRRVDIRMRG